MKNDIPSPSADQQAQAPRQSVEEVIRELEQYGVTSRQSTIYEWGGYSYSNSADAIAAAKRGAR
jgi:predicted transcriptional regulator